MKVIQMNIEEKSISKFMDELSCSFHAIGLKKGTPPSLNNISLNNKECIYLLDFVQNKIIYSKGFQNVLGFSDELIDMDFVLNDHHPDDLELVNRIRKTSIKYSFENPHNVLNNVLFICYKRRKKDDTYIRVLSESSVFEIDKNGLPLKVLTRMIDISFLDTSDVVKWSFQADNLNEEAFKKRIYSASYSFFTERENDIIREM